MGGFGVRSIFVRHVKKFHPDLSATMLQSLPQVNVKKCKLPPLNMPSRHVAPLTNGHTSSKPKRTPVSPKKFPDSYEKYENPAVPIPDRFPSPAYERSYSSPAPIMNGKTKVKSGAPKTPKTPKTIDYYSTLEQGGITCGAIEDPRKSSKAIDERVIINFRDKNVVIARFRDKNVYR